MNLWNQMADLVQNHVSIPLAVAIVLKASLFLAVAALVAHFLRRCSAAVRHLIWCIGLTGVLLIPLIGYLLPEWRIITWSWNRSTHSVLIPITSKDTTGEFVAFDAKKFLRQ